jgi:hypothetical protein
MSWALLAHAGRLDAGEGARWLAEKGRFLANYNNVDGLT